MYDNSYANIATVVIYNNSTAKRAQQQVFEAISNTESASD